MKISNGTGCTANVLLITPDKFIVANAGDSRSSLCKKGKALDLSKDHKPESP
jgi:protein phosphatase 2C family protein 2/3